MTSGFDDDVREIFRPLADLAAARNLRLEVLIEPAQPFRFLSFELRYEPRNVTVAVRDGEADFQLLAAQVAAARGLPAGWAVDGLKAVLTVIQEADHPFRRVLSLANGGGDPVLRLFAPGTLYRRFGKALICGSEISPVERPELEYRPATDGLSSAPAAGTGLAADDAWDSARLADAVAVNRHDRREFGLALRNWLDRFYLARSADQRSGMIAEAPPPTPWPFLDAYVAGIAEQLCEDYALGPPDWVYEPERFLEGAWYPEKAGRRVRTLLLANSPVAFRRRGLFIGPDGIHRASKFHTGDGG